MKSLKSERGFTVLEVLLVAGIASLLIVLAGSIAVQYAQRRSIDQITFKLSSSLNLAKMQAARHGVEYQTVCDYDAGTNIIDVEIQRGSSNVNTDFAPANEDITWEVMDNQSTEIEMRGDYIIMPGGDAQIPFHFNPNGTHEDAPPLPGLPPVLGAQTVTIAPTALSRIKKCGEITVTAFGRISTIIGNWDGVLCNPIEDQQQ